MSPLDYRKFLGKPRLEVLPYFGGPWVYDASRRFRVAVEQTPGWYQFDLARRVATTVDRADQPDLSDLPAVRGHFAHGWLFGGARELEPIRLLPVEEPPVLAPVVTRRLASGELVFDSVELESESDELARQALEEERGIDDLKHVGSSLRAAFGHALAARVGERLQIAISPREAMRAVQRLASEGRAGAEVLLRELEERRRLERVRVEAWAHSEGRGSLSEVPRGAERRPTDRVARALEHAGAELSATRDLGTGMLEVTYRFLGERFISIIDEHSLQVIDAGICLSGSDRMVTLESLPSVIREGYENGELNITRR